MVKRINVSIKEADFLFCESRDLKPSHLLRERINQMRDENSKDLREQFEEMKKELINSEKKREYISLQLIKVSERMATKLTPAEYNEVFE